MKKKLAAMVMTAMALAAVAAGPASADDLDSDDLFFGYRVFGAVVDDGHSSISQCTLRFS